MIRYIEEYFPQDTKKVFPDGGLFIWVEWGGDINTAELLEEARRCKVAFIAGEGFFSEGDGKGGN